MKVLHVLNEFRASGAEVMLGQAAPVWREHNVYAHALSTGAVPGFYADALASAGIVLHHLPFSKGPGYLRAFRRLLQEGNFDVVHIHPERANFWHALIARSTTSCVVRTVHNVFAFTGWLQLKRYAQRAMLRRIGVKTISVSNSVYQNEFSSFRNPTMHVPNWLDTDKFTPPDAAAQRKARHNLGVGEILVITTVGNCAPAKNHETLLRALANHPGDWLYLHVGQEDGHGPERALADQLGIASRCHWLGRVDNIAEVLAATDVYVMPSHYEGLPIAALEALATGTLSILAERPGLRDLRDLVKDRVIWVEPAPDAVAAALHQAAAELAIDISRRLDMHVAVRQHFGLERGALAYLAVYRDLRPSCAARTRSSRLRPRFF